jgi:hypothetical protein
MSADLEKLAPLGYNRWVVRNLWICIRFATYIKEIG